ncbi:hypothetical protein QBC44DRAFT_237257 [Cladorrhinum sp. PSN332]|nr:hypothetical protein QBC44DRAFT_237257 [Cladorrhinum sp. PSN332]
MLQSFTLPTRAYRRETATSEPLSQHPRQTQDRADAHHSSTSENVTPLRSRSSERFNSVLARFETGIFPRREPFVPSVPSYYSTYSLPATPARQSLDTRQAPPRVSETRGGSPFRHRTFSFESPSISPKLVVLPNKGGLEIDTLSEYGASNDCLNHPQIRSTSSSYPSEGIRSPDMCVSPPMTFGRRVLSSLSGFGFSKEHLSFLESDDHEMEDGPSTSDIPLYPGEENLTSTEAAIVAAIPHLTISRPTTCPPQVDRSHSLSSVASSSDINDETMEDINLSTECLPRLSTALSFSTSGRPSIDQSHRPSFSASLRSRISGHFRRHHNYNLRQSIAGQQKNTCCEICKPVRVVKVKKWFVRKLRAGRKGSRVIALKVRRISGAQDKEKVIGQRRRKKEAVISKSVRSRLMGVFGEPKSKFKGKDKQVGEGTEVDA